ncbi:peptidoglycan-binding protein [Ruegeria sp. THAF33]|uniref:peptidoglycan-binding domain-containing protein n=1 Tax=Ruegeria sp. THAF33 TaxID=2587853 RepID=UPI0012688D6B|nr:peptidoglycan-binding protein [Ruegeria sp. THAF33]QFT71803.1 Putative peptidoglycan binding domain protein [Ruegeria sp. THAF33]
MSTSPIDLCEVDVQDGILIQRGLHALGFYDGTFRGKPGPRTKDAYSRYRGADQTEEPVTGEILSYSSKVEDEFEFPGEIKTGARGIKARRVQEWLTFHNFRTAVDDDFGDATKRTVKKFQSARGLDSTGVVDEATWSHLVAPMLRAFARPEMDAPTSLSDAVLRIARQHLREHPVEISGQNKGPWVRAYMNGNEGDAWPWCAGFVTFVMKQAAKVNGIAMPIGGSFSCDILATQAKTAGLFVSERSLDNSPTEFSNSGLGSCCIFLVRRTSSDWTHTGFAFDYENGTFDTIEGNTNDEGSREGYEVCRRTRGRKKKDFIRL